MIALIEKYWLRSHINYFHHDDRNLFENILLDIALLNPGSCLEGKFCHEKYTMFEKIITNNIEKVKNIILYTCDF